MKKLQFNMNRFAASQMSDSIRKKKFKDGM